MRRHFKTHPYGLAATIATFLIFPILHKIHEIIEPNEIVKVETISDPPPLVMPDLPKPPEPLDDKQEKPEIEEDLKNVFIPPLPIVIEATYGPATISSSIRNVTEITGRQELIYTIGQLQKPPIALVQIDPLPPYHLRHIRAKVVVEFIIRSNGRVTDIQVTSSTHRELNAAAILSIKKSKWSPGEAQGQPVSTRVRLPILFNQ